MATVCKEAASIFGPEGYDLEVWNELSFGSQFLNAEYYDTPAGTEGVSAVTREITKALLDETVAYVRNPAHGIGPGVGISDGFASQTPFPSGANAPPGLTALSKHLYDGAKAFPTAYQERSLTPLNALGERDTLQGQHRPAVRAPLPVAVPRVLPDGDADRDDRARPRADHDRRLRAAARPQRRPTRRRAVAEVDDRVQPRSARPPPSAPTRAPPRRTTLTAADKAHFQAKALLRSLVAMINKGMTREYFYAAAGHALALIAQASIQPSRNTPKPTPATRSAAKR